MAPKKSKNDQSEKKSAIGENQFIVLLENMRDEIKLVAEGNMMLREEMQFGFKEVNKRMDYLERSLNGRMDSLERSLNGRMDSLDRSLNGRMGSLEDGMRVGFKTVLSELDKKADKKDLIALTVRVAKLETAK